MITHYTPKPMKEYRTKVGKEPLSGKAREVLCPNISLNEKRKPWKISVNTFPWDNRRDYFRNMNTRQVCYGRERRPESIFLHSYK